MKKKLIYGSIAGVLVVILVVVGIIIGGKDESASKDNDKIVSGDLETDKNPSDTSEEDESADGSDEIIGEAPEQDEEEDDSEVENNKDNSDEFVDDSTQEDDSSSSENEDNSSNDDSSNSENTENEDNSSLGNTGAEDNSGSTENEDNSSSTDSGNEDNSNSGNTGAEDNSSNTNSGFDNVSWTGNGVNLGSLGISIPTLKDFNDEALKGEANEGCGWTGASGDESFKILSNTLDNVCYALEDKNVLNPKTGQGFLIENYSISFDWASSSAYHDFQLTRDPATGTYTLTINMPLDTYISSFGKELAPYNRDIVLTMCSIFSSTPSTVYNALYKFLYEDASILYGSKYVEVGDCNILIDMNESYQGHYVFKIKSK